jgi:hypothetical protein
MTEQSLISIELLFKSGINAPSPGQDNIPSSESAGPSPIVNLNVIPPYKLLLEFRNERLSQIMWATNM